MPVFVDPNGAIAYPTHRCVECGNLLLRAAGLTCNECLRHIREANVAEPVPAPIDWDKWGILPRK